MSCKKLEYFEDLDDDRNDLSLYTSDAKDDTPTSPLKMRGMGLDFSSLSGAKKDEYIDDGPSIQESSVMVVFDLPDGSQGENMFKLGNTVEVLKSVVESDYGIPMTEQTMFLEDQPMMNPLSLLDFPDAKGVDEVYIRVEGPMPSSARK
mmetsp:Transcript_6229/g.9392  ORF Transcript_6229/g.9392 Transcript_6229/m.9392 type:complete len:149 (-) Transcript_6229:210-656(-)|eukprot:CAMPEP_0185018734 /NCGR_PEP_ID=MMETSP1103-20130426/1410_1 /TAXON_ID=36769 /ORGANISM="Paraphysomonas bandaiensis, Strain Caron Lab Isolate" /LENGTH=148 /DNA_ID=CAMNT_0027548685 /DNA_START=35 /DNA_END=481 /DNA_ORIENTATION=-